MRKYHAAAVDDDDDIMIFHLVDIENTNNLESAERVYATPCLHTGECAFIYVYKWTYFSHIYKVKTCVYKNTYGSSELDLCNQLKLVISNNH